MDFVSVWCTWSGWLGIKNQVPTNLPPPPPNPVHSHMKGTEMVNWLYHLTEALHNFGSHTKWSFDLKLVISRQRQTMSSKSHAICCGGNLFRFEQSREPRVDAKYPMVRSRGLMVQMDWTMVLVSLGAYCSAARRNMFMCTGPLPSKAKLHSRMLWLTCRGPYAPNTKIHSKMLTCTGPYAPNTKLHPKMLTCSLQGPNAPNTKLHTKMFNMHRALCSQHQASLKDVSVYRAVSSQYTVSPKDVNMYMVVASQHQASLWKCWHNYAGPYAATQWC